MRLICLNGWGGKLHDELVLSLKLKGGDVEEHYKPAAVPSVCPDMPKG